MGVTSVRFNEKEEKLLNYLKQTFHCDVSTLIKKSLKELYEDIKEREIVEKYEIKEDKEKTNFMTIEDLLD